MICNKCKKDQPEENFYVFNGRLQKICRTCKKKYGKAYFRKKYDKKLPKGTHKGNVEPNVKGLNDLGTIPATSIRRWTIDAVMCHDRGCICTGCIYQDFFSKDRNFPTQKCNMKASVLELVRKFGKPEIGVNLEHEDFKEYLTFEEQEKISKRH